MERKAKIVQYRLNAAISILRFSAFIENKGYPDTGFEFSQKLYEFGDSLINFPDKYPICRFKNLAKRKLRCAVFNKNYIL